MLRLPEIIWFMLRRAGLNVTTTNGTLSDSCLVFCFRTWFRGITCTSFIPSWMKRCLCNYQCKSRGGGGGSAGKGWGFDKFLNFLIKFPRVGNERSIKSVKKSPHPRRKYLNKQYYNTIQNE